MREQLEYGQREYWVLCEGEEGDVEDCGPGTDECKEICNRYARSDQSLFCQYLNEDYFFPRLALNFCINKCIKACRRIKSHRELTLDDIRKLHIDLDDCCKDWIKPPPL